MWVEKKSERRTQRERCVRTVGARRVWSGSCEQELRFRNGRKNFCEPTQLNRNGDNHREGGDVDQDILHNCDRSRCSQPARISEGRQDDEGYDERQVARESCSGNSKRADYDLNTNELKRNVRHGRNDAGDGDRESKPAIAKAAAHEIACRDVAVLVADVPEPRKNQKKNWIDDDCVRYRKEGDSTRAECERWDCDESVGRIKIAPDEKPRDDGSETPAAESPFVQEVEIPFSPICGGEAQPCDQGKQQYEDGKCDPVYVVHRIIFPAWLLRSR